MKYKLIIILFSSLLFFNTGCKRKKIGCMYVEATNYDPTAEVNGYCTFRPIITNPNFEVDDYWNTYTGTGYSGYAGVTNVGNGFMPTNGLGYFECVPTVYYTNGAVTQQYIGPNKHFKGIYFDYSYTAIAGPDSILEASCGIGFRDNNNYSYWYKIISETPASFGGFPSIVVKKIDQYMELHNTDVEGLFSISSKVSKGTFTLQIDNIRMVPRW